MVMNRRFIVRPGARAAAKAVPPKHMDNLGALMTFINKDDANKEDYKVKGSEIEFTGNKTLAIKTKNGTEEFGFNDWSFKQLASLLKIPSGFLETCPVVGRGSMKDNIEARMENKLANDFLIRVRRLEGIEGVSGLVRAVLPGEYTPFDNRQLVPAIQRAIGEIGADQFKLIHSNAHRPKDIESSLQLRFVKNDTFDIADLEDPHQVGFHCLTSEIGKFDITVSALVYRLVCTNGLMGWDDEDVVRLRHKNLQTHEVFPIVHEGILATTRQEAAIKELLERTVHETVTEPESKLLLAGKQMKLHDSITEKALELFRENHYPASRFGIMQAFTQSASQLPMDERIAVEETVGVYIFRGGRKRRRVGRNETIETTAEAT